MRAFILGMAFLLACGCGSGRGSADGGTSWLGQCSSSDDCGDGLDCTCGICTKSCQSSDECDSRSGHDAVCSDPAGLDLAADCEPAASKAASQMVCLQSCVAGPQCGARQRCVDGVCVGTPIPGSSVAVDSGLADAAGVDAAVVQSADAGQPDASTPVRHDAGSTVPPGPTPDDDGGGSAGCQPGDCSGALVCHLNGVCAAPGASDGHMVVTLAEVTDRDLVVTADAQFVYGVEYTTGDQYQEGPAMLMRWPVAGGPGEPMAQGASFVFPRSSVERPPLPLVVDQDHLYFVAATAASELSASLFGMPKDDSEPPTRYGTAGSSLAQDQDRLYFANDGDSRVLRAQKSMLDMPAAREQIFDSASDAPGSIVALAVNTASVFVTEVPPHVSSPATVFTIQRVDKSSTMATVLATSDKLTTPAAQTFADDDYFVMVGLDADRIDLATLEVKPLPGGNFAALAGGDLAAAPGYRTDDGGCFAVQLASATRTDLLTDYPFYVTSLAAVPGTLFAILTPNVNDSARYLARVTLP